TFLSHLCSPFLEIQPSFSCCVCQCFDFSLVYKAASVKDNLCNTFLFRSLSDHFAEVCCSLNIVGLLELSLHIFLKSGSGNKSISNGVIDDLSVHMIIASEHS